MSTGQQRACPGGHESPPKQPSHNTQMLLIQASRPLELATSKYKDICKLGWSGPYADSDHVNAKPLQLRQTAHDSWQVDLSVAGGIG